MSCEHIETASPLERRWHRVRCPECRAAMAADRGLARGIERLRAEIAPEAGLTRTLAAIGATSAVRAPRSRRWKAILRRCLTPTGAAAALLAGGWFYYLDVNPNVVVPTPAMPSSNAFDLFRQAHAAEVDSKNIDAALTGLGPKISVTVKNPDRGKPGQPATLTKQITKTWSLREKEELIRKNSAALRLLRQGLHYPYQEPPVRSPGTLMPYFSEDRALARLLELEALVRERRGDLPGAVNSSLDAMRMGAMLPRGSILTGKLVGIACEAIGRQQLWSQVERLDAAQARAAARRMEQIVQLHVPLTDSLQEESWYMQASLMEIFRNRRWRYSFSNYVSGQTSMVGWNPSGIYSVARLLPYSKRRIMHDVTEFWDSTLRDARLPYQYRKLATPQGQEQALARNWDPVIDVFCPIYTQAGFLDTAGCEVQDQLLMTAFALQAYQQEHHAYPKTLAALVPDYLSAVPIDPFGQGQPLGYRYSDPKMISDAGGQHWRYSRLYSVGPDGKDDDGSPITLPQWPYNRESKRFAIAPDSRGDIVAGVNTGINGN